MLLVVRMAPWPRMRRRAAGLLLFCFLAGKARADDLLGSITYLEGTVAVIRDGEEIAGVAIGGDVQNFDVVKTGSDGRAELDTTHAELMRSEAILKKWTEEDRRGRIGLASEVERERRIIGALLVRLRRTQFQLERVSFRLARLATCHEKGFGVGTLEDGVTTTQFFERVDRERADVERKLALTRYVAKMYAKRSEGKEPG